MGATRLLTPEAQADAEQTARELVRQLGTGRCARSAVALVAAAEERDRLRARVSELEGAGVERRTLAATERLLRHELINSVTVSDTLGVFVLDALGRRVGGRTLVDAIAGLRQLARRTALL